MKKMFVYAVLLAMGFGMLPMVASAEPVQKEIEGALSQVTDEAVTDEATEEAIDEADLEDAAAEKVSEGSYPM